MKVNRLAVSAPLVLLQTASGESKGVSSSPPGLYDAPSDIMTTTTTDFRATANQQCYSDYIIRLNGCDEPSPLSSNACHDNVFKRYEKCLGTNEVYENRASFKNCWFLKNILLFILVR